MDNFISRLKSISTKFHGSGSQTDAAPQNGSQTDGDANGQTGKPDRARRSKRKRRERPPVQFPGKTALVRTGQAIGAVGSFHNRQPLLLRLLFWLGVFGCGGRGRFGLCLLDNGAHAAQHRRHFWLCPGRDAGRSRPPMVPLCSNWGPATRDKLALEQIPDPLIKAFIASEDRRFYKHSGVDYQSVGRAIASNIVAKDAVEGASTITQQLARLVYLNQRAQT